MNTHHSLQHRVAVYFNVAMVSHNVQYNLGHFAIIWPASLPEIMAELQIQFLSTLDNIDAV